MQQIKEILREDQIQEQEPMHKHTTFRIGGAARWFLRPDTEEALRQVLDWCSRTGTPYFFLGNGSNLLVSDRGFDGAVIQLGPSFQGIVQEGDGLRVGAGTMLAHTAGYAAEHSLGGLEFASGIPGTLGGAVFMNAGAYGGEMKQVVSRIRVMTQQGRVYTLEKEELDMGYRTSRVKEQNLLVLEAELALSHRPETEIRAQMEKLKEARRQKQPLEYPSAGSTFKRPEGYFAGKLIMEAGLRGFRVGDAQVSEKHCGFVVNRGRATAGDVMELARQVQEKVLEQSGVRLELEIQTLGFVPGK
jgi:UDP-N-acetylmuramate dehydrogenase